MVLVALGTILAVAAAARSDDLRQPRHGARASRAGDASVLSELQGHGSPSPESRHEFATEKEALREIFPEGSLFVRQLLAPDPAVRAVLAERLRRTPPPTPLLTYLIFDKAERFRGYGVVAEEIGKYRPITFLVGVDPGLEVREVQVLAYRESRGMEVRRRRFLQQFEGKSSDDPLRPDREILNVTGATLSVRAMSAGVKRVLATLEFFYGDRVPSLAEAREAAVLQVKR